MEEKSLCLMLAASLHTAIDLDAVISQDDLIDDGVIKDSHITIVYDKESKMSKDNILSDVEESLGDRFPALNELLKDSYKFKVNDVMYLEVFYTDDKDVIVLRLKDNNQLFQALSDVHYHMLNKYSITTDYPEYKPHLTLAYVAKGEADKYLTNPILMKVLDTAKVGFEDFVFSKKIEDGKYEKWNITTHHALTRYFRETRVD